MNKIPTVYISGPMTGIKDKNKSAFYEKHKQIVKKFGMLIDDGSITNFEIINPAYLVPDAEEPEWIDYMRKDLAELMKCNTIFFIEGWEKSKGARLEFEIGKSLGFEMYDPDCVLMDGGELERFDSKENTNTLSENKSPEQVSILEEADQLTNGDRQSTYGHPSINFKNISDGWNWYVEMQYGIQLELVPEDVAMMMTLLKMARETHAQKRDNIVDAVGYLNTYQMCLDKKNEEEEWEDEDEEPITQQTNLSGVCDEPIFEGFGIFNTNLSG